MLDAVDGKDSLLLNTSPVGRLPEYYSFSGFMAYEVG